MKPRLHLGHRQPHKAGSAWKAAGLCVLILAIGLAASKWLTWYGNQQVPTTQALADTEK